MGLVRTMGRNGDFEGTFEHAQEHWWRATFRFNKSNFNRVIHVTDEDGNVIAHGQSIAGDELVADCIRRESDLPYRVYCLYNDGVGTQRAKLVHFESPTGDQARFYFRTPDDQTAFISWDPVFHCAVPDPSEGANFSSQGVGGYIVKPETANSFGLTPLTEMQPND